MKKKLYAIVTVIILAALFILTSRGTRENIPGKDIPDRGKSNTNMEVDMPDISGTVTNLPWANSSDFLKAQEENGTHVLMAAYCAVLEDLPPNEEFNVSLASSSIAGFVLEPGEIFSQNDTIGPYNEKRGYKIGQSYSGSEITTTVGGGVCKIATTLYNASVYSNMEIIERHNHFMPVPYVPYGQDATVAYGSKDLKFKNNTEFPILIWAEGIGNRLYVALYGEERPPDIAWNHKFLKRIPVPKIYQTNPELQYGKERVLAEGMEGALVESWITITNSEGVIKTRHMGLSQYWPMPCIIEINK